MIAVIREGGGCAEVRLHVAFVTNANIVSLSLHSTSSSHLGLVVASVGSYFLIASMSPVSATMVVNFESPSNSFPLLYFLLVIELEIWFRFVNDVLFVRMNEFVDRTNSNRFKIIA